MSERSVIMANLLLYPLVFVNPFVRMFEVSTPWPYFYFLLIFTECYFDAKLSPENLDKKK